jgi:hypothetical protein
LKHQNEWILMIAGAKSQSDTHAGVWVRHRCLSKLKQGRVEPFAIFSFHDLKIDQGLRASQGADDTLNAERPMMLH